MAGYIIVQIDVTDPEVYEEYKAQVPAATEKYGGEYLVRGGEMEILEGEWELPRVVVIRFPSVADAKAWHNSVEYEGPKALRQASSRGNMIVVEGA